MPKKALSGFDFLGYDLSNADHCQQFHHHLIRELGSGRSVKDVLHFPEALMESLYSCAHARYNNKKPSEGASIFNLLVFLGPQSYRYLFGLGVCLAATGDHQEAINQFVEAAKVDKKNPNPAYYAAESLVKMNQGSKAIFALDEAIKLAGKNLEIYNTVRTRAIALRATLIGAGLEAYKWRSRRVDDSAAVLAKKA